MVGGSFYTTDYEMAQGYADIEDDGIVYEFNPIINLLDVSDLICESDIDEGIVTIIEELKESCNIDDILKKYDGVKSYHGQIVLFGTLDIYDDFKKQELSDLLKDGVCDTRVFNR